MPKHPLTSSRARWVLGLCAVFLTAEIGLRLGGYRPPPPATQPQQYDPASDPIPRAGDGLHGSSTRELWTPTPGAAIRWSAGERVNSEGYRGELLAQAKQPGTLRLAVLGDGITFGEGVASVETYGAQLAQKLGERGAPAEALDAGVIGYSVEQCFERYLALVRPCAPDVVILSTSGLEDSTASPYLSDRMRMRMSIRDAAGWSFVSQSPQLDLRALIWLHERVRAATTEEVDPREIEAALHRRRGNRSLMTAGSGSADWAGMRRVSLEEFEKCLTRFVRLVRVDGARPILVCLPMAPEIEAASSVLAEYRRIVCEIAKRERVQVVDPRAGITERIASGENPGQFFSGPRWRPASHSLLAEQLALAVLAPEFADQ